MVCRTRNHKFLITKNVFPTGSHSHIIGYLDPRQLPILQSDIRIAIVSDTSNLPQVMIYMYICKSIYMQVIIHCNSDLYIT